MSAALTPRVRKIVVCDGAAGSDIEDEVFTLEGVRHGFAAESFPCVRALSVYLLLSYPRGGSFTGEVKLAAADEDRTIRVSRFTVDFDQGMVHALTVDLGDCTFPAPGLTPSRSAS